MIRAFKLTVTGAALTILLAACGGGSDNDNDPGAGGSGVTGSGTTQGQFGSIFEAAFNRGSTEEPVTGLTSTSIGAVNFTSDPVAIN